MAKVGDVRIARKINVNTSKGSTTEAKAKDRLATFEAEETLFERYASTLGGGEDEAGEVEGFGWDHARSLSTRSPSVWLSRSAYGTKEVTAHFGFTTTRFSSKPFLRFQQEFDFDWVQVQFRHIDCTQRFDRVVQRFSVAQAGLNPGCERKRNPKLFQGEDHPR